jgi:hypothetical protein
MDGNFTMKLNHRNKIAALCLAGALWVAGACGVGRGDVPTTQPSAAASNNPGQLQLAANEDMARGDYAGALPLLQKASESLSDQPDQIGPVLEQIRVCKHQIANGVRPAPTPSVVTAVDGSVRKIHPLPRPGETVELVIKELGNFDYDATNGGNIPPDVLAMEGCHIKTTGYMIPLDQAERISNFALVPSLLSCCFGQPPQIQHTLVVTCPKDHAMSYFPDELTVEGTLHVKEVRDSGFIVSIFQIDATSVRAAAQ